MKQVTNTPIPYTFTLENLKRFRQAVSAPGEVQTTQELAANLAEPSNMVHITSIPEEGVVCVKGSEPCMYVITRSISLRITNTSSEVSTYTDAKYLCWLLRCGSDTVYLMENKNEGEQWLRRQ